MDWLSSETNPAGFHELIDLILNPTALIDLMIYKTKWDPSFRLLSLTYELCILWTICNFDHLLTLRLAFSCRLSCHSFFFILD